jgi:hypothetical protein
MLFRSILTRSRNLACLTSPAFRLLLIPPSFVQPVLSVLAFFTFLAAIAHGGLLLPVLLNPALEIAA